MEKGYCVQYSEELANVQSKEIAETNWLPWQQNEGIKQWGGRIKQHSYRLLLETELPQRTKGRYKVDIGENRANEAGTVERRETIEWKRSRVLHNRQIGPHNDTLKILHAEKYQEVVKPVGAIQDSQKLFPE